MVFIPLTATRNPANSPVEIGSLSHYLQGFGTIPGGDRRISSINSISLFPTGFIPVRWFSRRISGCHPFAGFSPTWFDYAQLSNWESSSQGVNISFKPPSHEYKSHGKLQIVLPGQFASPPPSPQKKHPCQQNPRKIHKLKGSGKTEDIPQII